MQKVEKEKTVYKLDLVRKMHLSLPSFPQGAWLLVTDQWPLCEICST